MASLRCDRCIPGRPDTCCDIQESEVLGAAWYPLAEAVRLVAPTSRGRPACWGLTGGADPADRREAPQRCSRGADPPVDESC
ncbi:hypothetical protein ETD86_29925 [Nonomuraea turkmeniaca]|uniref:Uncharacterized protein n=1 Tax=Nonomuraea turkmeniaca TaxID=103838 RepID=A0A5S4F9Q2_9ACTN|nr:hypothetical protein ETD86_29925 [Nonomuraea turkmeniaca]